MRSDYNIHRFNKIHYIDLGKQKEEERPLSTRQEENNSEQESVRAYAGKHACAYMVEYAYETRSVHLRTCHKWVHITINKYFISNTDTKVLKK